MSKIKLSCEICEKEFERERGEHNRNKKMGRRIYCSLNCCGKGNADNELIAKDMKLAPFIELHELLYIFYIKIISLIQNGFEYIKIIYNKIWKHLIIILLCIFYHS